MPAFRGGVGHREESRFQAVSYVLIYREPGKRPNTTREAKRKVESVRAAVDWMNANADKAFRPCHVQTNAWKPEIVAILG